MKRRQRRETEVFSLSFLDCICCGFGAIILLLVLSEFGVPIQLEQAKTDLDAQIAKLQQELYELRGTSVVLERELRGRDRAAFGGAEARRAAAWRPVGDRGQAQGQHLRGGVDEEDRRVAGGGAPRADRGDAASCRDPGAGASTTSRSQASRSTANR